jgi:chemotaxis protein MotB
LELDTVKEQLVSAQTSEAAARAGEAAWKQQHDGLLSKLDDQGKRAATLEKENAEQRANLEILNAKYTDAMNQKTATFLTVNQLPAELTNALEQFALQNPLLVEFDARAGLVKFKSDLIFAKGSAELTPQAKEATARLAAILASPAARDYEFLIAGHTDSTPVTNPETIRAGHKDNWYLSAHRAIAVKNELAGHQINPGRIGVLGYGDQRPIANNGTTEGQAKNRRVEVLLLPSTYKSGGLIITPADGAPAVGGPKRTPAQPANGNKGHQPTDLNKDTVIEKRPEPRAILNK